MENGDITGTAPLSDYDRAKIDMLKMRDSFMKLNKADQERLIKEAVAVWAPGADPFKTKIIVGTLTKFIG